jgi:glutamate--cysteine ligase
LRGDATCSMRTWALEIMEGSQICAQLLDQAKGGSHYQQAVQQQIAKIENPSLTPSARVLEDMQQQQQSFFTHTQALAEQHRNYFSQRQLDENSYGHFVNLSEKSLDEQKKLEQQQQGSFDEYLANYYIQYQGCSCGK